MLSERDSEGGEEPRRNRGASGSESEELLFRFVEGADDGDGEERGAEDTLLASPVPISARGPPSSAPETRRGRDDVPEPELPADAPEFAFERPASSEREDDGDERRRRGRSGSLSSGGAEAPEDVRLATFLFSSESEERRRTGLSADLFPAADEAEEEEPLSGRGSGAISSICSDASECSSVVPVWTIEIDDAL